MIQNFVTLVKLMNICSVQVSTLITLYWSSFMTQQKLQRGFEEQT